jgi:hypothetical protein
VNNRQRLIDLIAEFRLDRRDIAELLHVRRDTVDHWLFSGESKSHEEIPEMAIELLEYKLGARRPPDVSPGPGI